MGAAQSREPQVEYSSNDYELAIVLTKEAESYLEENFHAGGKGLHEKVSDIEGDLPSTTVKSLRYLASCRNRLIHDRTVHALDNREAFIRCYTVSMKELERVTSERNRQPTQAQPPACIIS